MKLSFRTARDRLMHLVHEGCLGAASNQAYTDGYAAAIRVGPSDQAPSASKLLQIRFAEPVTHDQIAVLPMRWEAAGPAASLFPVLDADITLMPAGEQTRLALTGSYRPPLGGLGAALDKIMLHHIASATVSSFLRTIAHELSNDDRLHRG